MVSMEQSLPDGGDGRNEAGTTGVTSRGARKTALRPRHISTARIKQHLTPKQADVLQELNRH